MTESTSNRKKPPKGGRKGGAVFPRVALEQAVMWAKKLVSKTHTGPQPESVILPGVFGNAGTEGGVRASALRQYGLLDGNGEAYSATELAKEINAATEDESTALLQRALLTPKVFKGLYDTFHGDTVSLGKLKQQALKLKVHPDSAEECANLFQASCVTAKVASKNGDDLSLATIPAQNEAQQTSEEKNDPDGTEDSVSKRDAPQIGPRDQGGNESAERPLPSVNRSGVNLSISVDASLDADKLERQLHLLRKYGLI